jgi:addiction module HigA family antidote
MEQDWRADKAAHPGPFIWSEVIQPHGLSVTEAAMALGVTRPALSKLLNGRARLSPEMALRIEKAFGVAMDTLMRMQGSYDIAEARKNEKMIQVLPFQGRPRLTRMKSA